MTDLHDNVKRRLEDAGRTLMMLPMPARGMPAQPHSAWPEYAIRKKYWDVFGHADEDEAEERRGTAEERREIAAGQINSVRLQASQKAVDRLDEVLGWLLSIDRPHWRKTVAARMLVHPVSQRPVHSWTEIAKTLGTNRRTVRHWHDSGVQAILERLSEAA